MAITLVAALIPPVAMASPSAADELPPAGCADLIGSEENHSSIRLQVDQPASGAEVSVDAQGKINVVGILHKQATMVDVTIGQVVASNFVIGPPPAGVSAWASSWSTSLRPPHLGANKLCARAVRDPKRTARVLRSFTVVDLIPPSNVPNLAVSNITATTARVSWGGATDNYGLAGYVVTVDGGAPQRTTVGNRTYTITGLAPSTQHTVSVVAIDLAGNTSTTPATPSFTTQAPPPPPNGDLAFAPEQGGANATWRPDLPTDVTYRVFLNGQLFDEFPVGQYCQDSNGNPANPCTTQNIISCPIEPLEEFTPYAFRVDTVRADGTVARSLSGSFTTMVSVGLGSPATTQLNATESSRCAGMGGDFYVSATVRGSVPIPAGSTQVFEGCYSTPNSDCLDASCRHPGTSCSTARTTSPGCSSRWPRRATDR